MAKFPNSAELLDAMGTWQLMQRRLPEAVRFYEMAEKLDPKRKRTLNNLAMALSEMSGKTQDALIWIEKAVRIYGREPDLLDTLGQVSVQERAIEGSLGALLEASGRKEDVTSDYTWHKFTWLTMILCGQRPMGKNKQSDLKDVVLTPAIESFSGVESTVRRKFAMSTIFERPLGVALSVSVAISLVSGLSHGWLDGRWINKPNVQAIGERLTELPKQFGEWIHIEDQELPESAAAMLQCYGYSLQVYQNGKTGRRVTVAVLFGPRGPIAVHTPEVCYSGRGIRASGKPSAKPLTSVELTTPFGMLVFNPNSIRNPH